MPSSADTRERILEAAWDLVVRGGVDGLTLARVGRAAGVSRQSVYLHFSDRAGLLGAMTEHHDRASGFLERVAAIHEAPPAEALEGLLRAFIAYTPGILPVTRALEAAGTHDGARPASRERMDQLRGGIGRIVRRLAEDGRLAAGWEPEAAADWAWAACHWTAYDHLVVERGWTPAAFADRVVATVTAVLLRPDGG